MIIGLALIGLLLIDSALKGTEHELAQRLQTDMLGADGFIAWIFAIAAIGAIGYIPGLETASNYLLALLMVVIVLRNGGLWTQLQTALQTVSQTGPAPSIAPKAITADGQQSSGGSGAGGSSGSSSNSTDQTLATVGEVASIAAIAFSDRRMKENLRYIKTVGGMRVYSFNYVGSKKRHHGVMADEIAVSHPHAIGHRAGWLTVNYDLLGKLA